MMLASGILLLLAAQGPGDQKAPPVRYPGGSRRRASPCCRQDGALGLSGYDRDGIIEPNGPTNLARVNYLARRMIMKTGVMVEDAPDQTKTVTLPNKSQLTIDQVGDSLAFDPDEH